MYISAKATGDGEPQGLFASGSEERCGVPSIPAQVIHLREEVDLLRSSAAAFDQGDDAEAERLAITLRTLLHHTPDSRSLLEQLGEQQPLAFVDTAPPPNQRNLLSYMGLLPVESEHAVARWVAMPPRAGHTKPFEAWWNDTVVKDSSGEEFSRKTFVLTLANEAGDGNIEATLDERYARLVAPFVVRQITYEALETLKQLPYVVGV